jgi:hypothetical protein
VPDDFPPNAIRFSSVQSRPMTTSRPVIVEMRARPVTGAASRWVSHQWAIASVRDASPEMDAPETDETDTDEMAVAGLNIELHKTEGEGYWLNLTSDAPCVFVMWRQEPGEMPVPWLATVSYNEAGRMLDAGEKVENLPMSESMRAWLQAFTDAHYTPEARKKVKRNDPFKQGAFRREGKQ